MNAVLMSIKPQYLELIACGRKKLEFRKVIPKLEEPYKVYLYQTKHKWFYKILKGLGFEKYYDILTNNSGKVVGEFICDYVMRHCEMANADLAEQQGWMKREKILEYANGKEVFGLRITNLVIYDKPKALEEFCILDKEKQKQCAYRERYYVNPDLSNGAALKAVFTCNLGHEIDFCRPFDNTCPCFKVLHRPPQSWCYVVD